MTAHDRLVSNIEVAQKTNVFDPEKFKAAQNGVARIEVAQQKAVEMIAQHQTVNKTLTK